MDNRPSYTARRAGCLFDLAPLLKTIATLNEDVDKLALSRKVLPSPKRSEREPQSSVKSNKVALNPCASPIRSAKELFSFRPRKSPNKNKAVSPYSMMGPGHR